MLINTTASFENDAFGGTFNTKQLLSVEKVINGCALVFPNKEKVGTDLLFSKLEKELSELNFQEFESSEGNPILINMDKVVHVTDYKPMSGFKFMQFKFDDGSTAVLNGDRKDLN